MVLYYPPTCDLPLDPVFFKDGGMSYEDMVLKEAGIMVINFGWYFVGMTWSDEHGSYPTKEECEKALDEYQLSCYPPMPDPP